MMIRCLKPNVIAAAFDCQMRQGKLHVQLSLKLCLIAFIIIKAQTLLIKISVSR